jgi:hypothetical protein
MAILTNTLFERCGKVLRPKVCGKAMETTKFMKAVETVIKNIRP